MKPIKTFHVIFGVCDSILQLLLHRHLSKYFSFVQGDLHYACYIPMRHPMFDLIESILRRVTKLEFFEYYLYKLVVIAYYLVNIKAYEIISTKCRDGRSSINEKRNVYIIETLSYNEISLRQHLNENKSLWTSPMLVIIGKILCVQEKRKMRPIFYDLWYNLLFSELTKYKDYVQLLATKKTRLLAWIGLGTSKRSFSIHHFVVPMSTIKSFCVEGIQLFKNGKKKWMFSIMVDLNDMLSWRWWILR